MKSAKAALRFLLKTVTAIILIAAMAIVATSVSPIYDFGKAEPFDGPDIFNPYRDIDSAL